MKDIAEFEKKIELKFKNKDTLLKAFVHKSYVNEHRDFSIGDNERLEFLGDAVLELVVTDELFRRYTKKSEGELTAIRAALVNAKSLSSAAKDLNMDDFLLLSKGEARSTGRSRDYILANAFEAVVGAIYFDLGMDAAKAFIAANLFTSIEEIVKNKLWIDSKSHFQEKAQEVLGITPEYKLITESGPDHNKVFTMGVYVNGKLMGEGSGASKQDAEQVAAREALESKGWL